LSVVVPAQPHFAAQEPGTSTLWGYALFGDVEGDHVPKKMDDCTGREILGELLGHLGCTDLADEVRATTRVTTVQMPYIDAQFQRRVVAPLADRMVFPWLDDGRLVVPAKTRMKPGRRRTTTPGGRRDGRHGRLSLAQPAKLRVVRIR
jgi:hypothetical protein